MALVWQGYYVYNVYNKSLFPYAVNGTHVALTPKCEILKGMKDLCPISLCNMLYKILSKFLTNRLKKDNGKCISADQSTFIHGHSILDNALIANEILHHMKCKVKGKMGEVTSCAEDGYQQSV